MRKVHFNLNQIQKCLQVDFSDDRLDQVIEKVQHIAKSEEKVYVLGGKYLIKSVYAIRYYRQKQTLDAKNLSQRIDENLLRAISRFFKRYQIPEYISHEDQKIGTEFVLRLIYTLYLFYGFLKMYSIFERIFSVPPKGNQSNRYIVNEYGNTFHIMPEYKMLDSICEGGKKYRVCQLLIGSKTSIGKGVKEKGAREDAAFNFIKKYDILQNLQHGSELTRDWDNRELTQRRCKDLETASLYIYTENFLSQNYLSYGELDEVLTQYDAPNGNSAINIIGATISALLNCDYTLQYKKTIVPVNLTSFIERLDAQNLGEAVPAHIGCFINGFRDLDEILSKEARLEILHCVIAFAVIKYVQTGNSDIMKFIHRLSHNAFAISDRARLTKDNLAKETC